MTNIFAKKLRRLF